MKTFAIHLIISKIPCFQDIFLDRRRLFEAHLTLNDKSLIGKTFDEGRAKSCKSGLKNVSSCVSIGKTLWF